MCERLDCCGAKWEVILSPEGVSIDAKGFQVLK